ncbi:putative protein containing caspase domain protein [Roseibium album]|nr:putative protein containing caspase domain protein [Roseibium album]
MIRILLIAIVICFSSKIHAAVPDWIVDDPDVEGMFVADVFPGERNWWQRILIKNIWLQRITGATPDFERSIAIVVGIGSYDDWAPLSGPTEDAKRMRAFLLNSEFDEVYTITDREVTRKRINDLISHVQSRLNYNGRFVFYWSGHGGQTNADKPEGFLPLSNTPTDGTGTRIAMREIYGYAAAVSAKHQLLILDACFSGGVVPQVASSGRVVSSLSQKVTLMLTSSAEDEYSYGQSQSAGPNGSAAGGYLTTAFLNSVGANGADRIADFDRNGFVTMTEVQSSVRNELLAISAAQAFEQDPRLRPIGPGKGDFFFLSPRTWKSPENRPNSRGLSVRFGNIAEPKGPQEIATAPVEAKPTLAPYLMDSFSNLLRKPGEEAIAIRPTASQFRLSRNELLREEIAGAAAFVEAEIIKLAIDRVLKILDQDSSSGRYISPPIVKEVHLYAPNKDEYLDSCRDWSDFLQFAQTAHEMMMVYKTIRSRMFGASNEELITQWGDGKFPPESGIVLDDGHDFNNRNDISLDSFLNSGVLERNYELFANGLDQLEPIWQWRIAKAASLLLAYEAINGPNEVVSPSGEKITRNPDLSNTDNPFGCKGGSDYNIEFSFMLGEVQTYASISYEKDSKDKYQYQQFNDAILEFWSRRQTSGTSKKLRELLINIANDFSGTVANSWDLREMALNENE